MMLMVVLAVLCAGVLCWVLHPLMRGADRKKGWVILGLCAVMALGVYLAVGSPGVASAPAVFETSGPRHDARLAQQRELIIMEALAGDPDNIGLLLELGVIRVQGGRPEDALEVLARAHKLAPRNAHVAETMGAAHYKLALLYATLPRPEARKKARQELDEALRITPKSTALYKELKRLKKRF